VATEAQPIEQQPAEAEASQEGGRWGEHKAKAKTAFEGQKQNVARRLRDWFATTDIDDHKLAEQVVDAKRRKAQQQDDHLLREVGRVNGRLAQARVHAAQQGKETTPEVERIRGELAALQARVETRAAEGPMIAVMPPTSKDVDRARWTKKATRVGAVLAGGYGFLYGIAAEPGLLLLSIPTAGFGWWFLSRPIVGDQEGEAPFGQTPASLPATFLAEPAGGAPTVGGNVVMHVEQLPEGAKPFPIRHARTPDQLAQCVLLAARAENVPIVEVSDVTRQPWGWQCTVRVSEGTPEAIIVKSGGLETKFDLPTNGVRPQPIQARRACAILRLVDGDPFATAPGLPYRPPKSMSITGKFRIGTSVGGDPLELSLAGVMGLWVAASGGGKTGILQALAEGTTACYDNITIDLDPHGDGLEDLGDCVRITARTNEQIEAVLLFFLVMSKARARLRQKLGMGKKWKASATHPAVTIFFDEFPKATELAKKLAFDLLLVGRKELIEVEIASQGGQKGYLGENFAQMVALKAVGPCKVGDTRAVFGDGAVAEGYLPHKLSPATDTDPKDAGHIYLQGVPGRPDEPIEYAIHETPSAALRKLAEERLEAGLVEPDQDSLDAMRGVDLPEYVEAVYDNDGNIKKDAPVELLTWDALLRLCGAQPVERGPLEDGAGRTAVEDAVAIMQKADVDRMKTETLLLALRDYDPDAYGEMDVEAFKALMKKAGAGAPISLGQIGKERNPRGFKRDRLRHLL
jgi:S-DNA-T family DNA segregation ATPase FtsK/SpoIIIE